MSTAPVDRESGPATTLNNAPRRRPAGPMHADPRQDADTVGNPRHFPNRSIALKPGLIAADIKADPTVGCRVLHRIFLTPRLSCGARAAATPTPTSRAPSASTGC